MNVLHAFQNLSHVVLDMLHWNDFVLLLRILDDLLKIVLTKLKYEVLNYLSLLIFGIIYVQKLNHVFTLS